MPIQSTTKIYRPTALRRRVDIMLTDAHYDELTRLLHADVRALVPLVFPHDQPVKEAHLRLMAVIMRRWILEGDLKKLLQPLRQSALFTVQDNGEAQAYLSRSGAFRYYLTAGVRLNGRPVSHIYESKMPASAIDTRFARQGSTRLGLKKFLAQPRLFHEGHWFSTAQILRFVANKLGGNHLDFDRSGEWERLDAANQFMRFGGPVLGEPPTGWEVYLILEPAGDEVIGGVHLEVLAAVASFVQMDIGGQPLCTLTTETSLVGRLRMLLARRPGMRMVERPVG